MRRTLAMLYCGAVVGAGVIGVTDPVAFQKANSIVAARGIEPIRETSAFDVAPRVAAIPDGDRANVWDVHPAKRHRETVERGRGNCSNLVFGLAFELDRTGVDFQVVHLLDEKFLDGSGHTVVRTHLRLGSTEQVGILDLLEGGLPASGGRLLDVQDLSRGAVPEFSLVALNDRSRADSAYYGEFLREARLGYVPAREVAEYFRFIEAVYVPLGSPQLEKYLYDGLAVLLGFYPKIHVPDFAGLFAGWESRRARSVTACWILRSALFAPTVFALHALAAALLRQLSWVQQGPVTFPRRRPAAR